MNPSLFDPPAPAVDLDAEIERMNPRISRYAPAQPPDITRQRHLGNEESEAANRRIHPSKEATRRRIVELVRFAGARGMTSKEIAAALEKPLHAISGRLSEMKAEKPPRLLEADGSRDGARVLVSGPDDTFDEPERDWITGPDGDGRHGNGDDDE